MNVMGIRRTCHRLRDRGAQQLLPADAVSIKHDKKGGLDAQQ